MTRTSTNTKIDTYRQTDALSAALVLTSGKSNATVSSDHSGSETCAQTIVRLQDIKPSRRDALLADNVQKAALKLRSGLGWQLVSGDHGAGETCAETIARKG